MEKTPTSEKIDFSDLDDAELIGIVKSKDTLPQYVDAANQEIAKREDATGKKVDNIPHFYGGKSEEEWFGDNGEIKYNDLANYEKISEDNGVYSIRNKQTGIKKYYRKTQEYEDYLSNKEPQEYIFHGTAYVETEAKQNNTESDLDEDQSKISKDAEQANQPFLDSEEPTATDSQGESDHPSISNPMSNESNIKGTIQEQSDAEPSSPSNIGKKIIASYTENDYLKRPDERQDEYKARVIEQLHKDYPEDDEAKIQQRANQYIKLLTGKLLGKTDGSHDPFLSTSGERDNIIILEDKALQAVDDISNAVQEKKDKEEEIKKVYDEKRKELNANLVNSYAENQEPDQATSNYNEQMRTLSSEEAKERSDAQKVYKEKEREAYDAYEKASEELEEQQRELAETIESVWTDLDQSNSDEIKAFYNDLFTYTQDDPDKKDDEKSNPNKTDDKQSSSGETDDKKDSLDEIEKKRSILDKINNKNNYLDRITKKEIGTLYRNGFKEEIKKGNPNANPLTCAINGFEKTYPEISEHFQDNQDTRRIVELTIQLNALEYQNSQNEENSTPEKERERAIFEAIAAGVEKRHIQNGIIQPPEYTLPIHNPDALNQILQENNIDKQNLDVVDASIQGFIKILTSLSVDGAKKFKDEEEKAKYFEALDFYYDFFNYDDKFNHELLLDTLNNTDDVERSNRWMQKLQEYASFRHLDHEINEETKEDEEINNLLQDEEPWGEDLEDFLQKIMEQPLEHMIDPTSFPTSRPHTPNLSPAIEMLDVMRVNAFKNYCKEIVASGELDKDNNGHPLISYKRAKMHNSDYKYYLVCTYMKGGLSYYVAECPFKNGADYVGVGCKDPQSLTANVDTSMWNVFKDENHKNRQMHISIARGRQIFEATTSLEDIKANGGSIMTVERICHTSRREPGNPAQKTYDRDPIRDRKQKLFQEKSYGVKSFIKRAEDVVRTIEELLQP